MSSISLCRSCPCLRINSSLIHTSDDLNRVSCISFHYGAFDCLFKARDLEMRVYRGALMQRERTNGRRTHSRHANETMSSLEFNDEIGKTRVLPFYLPGRISNGGVRVSATIDHNSEQRPILLCIGLTAVLLFLIGLIYSSVEQCWQSVLDESIAQQRSSRPRACVDLFFSSTCLYSSPTPTSVSVKSTNEFIFDVIAACVHPSCEQSTAAEQGNNCIGPRYFSTCTDEF